MEVLNRIAEIFLLGVIGGSVPGPILTSVLTEVLNGGMGKGIRVILRALTAEVIVAGTILFILSAVDVPRIYFEIISVLGAIYLVYLAINVWKINKIDGENKEVFNLYKIFVLTVLNGGFWIFWLTVCVPKAFVLGQEIAGGQIVFLIMFELGWLTSTFSVSYIFFKFRPLLLRKNLVSSVFKFFALVLIFFAIRAIRESAAYIMWFL